MPARPPAGLRLPMMQQQQQPCRLLARRQVVFRSRRSFHQSRPRRQDQAEAFRDVRIQRPFFTWRRLFRYSIYAYISYRSMQWGFNRLMEGVELDADDDDDDAADEAKRQTPDGSFISADQDEEDDEALFIPLQYPQKLPRAFYRNSDPDWQEFKRLSYDDARQKVIRKELVENVTSTVNRHPILRRRLGEDITWSRYWLDFTFPDSPPPEYTRRGFGIADDFVGLTEQIIPHADYVKIQHILWPKAIYKAASDSLTLLYNLQAIKVKTMLGVELTTKEKTVLQHLNMFKMQKAKADAAAEMASQQQQIRQENIEKLGPSTGSHHGQKRDLTPQPPGQLKGESNPGNPSSGFTINITVPKPPVPLELQLSSRVFMGALTQQWTHSRTDFSPPGCCYLWGNVEIAGSRAKCKLDVLAAYDPKQAKFVYVTSKPKHFWELQQNAKGGP